MTIFMVEILQVFGAEALLISSNKILFHLLLHTSVECSFIEYEREENN